MKNFLKFTSHLVSYARFKSKQPKYGKDKDIVKRLDYESTLLYGEPLKRNRKKSRKNAKLVPEEEDSENCLYYEISKNQETSPDKCNASIKDCVVQSLTQVDPSSPEENVTINQYEKSNEQPTSSIDEPVPLFPLFNEAKKEYISSQPYYINPIRKKEHGTFPTVSAILGETMSENSKMLLNRWKENQIAELGHDKFNEQQKKQMQTRNLLLKLIQKRLLGVRNEDLEILPEFEGCWQSLDCVFPLFSKVRAMGRMVVHPNLKYKGMIDSIIEFKDRPVLVSWKKSSKLKSSIDMTFDTPVQIAAYIGAISYDTSYPFKVEESLLVMSYDDGSKADIFHLKKENCLYYWKLWLERFRLYQLKNPEFKLDPQEEKNSEPEVTLLQNEDAVPPPVKGFSSTAYLTFTQVQTKESRRKKAQDVHITFPLYNDIKKPYVSGQPYEINPVKENDHASYPSVTSILSQTKSESSKFVLQKWKDDLIAQLGEEGFAEYQRKLFETGSQLHSLIEQRLLGTAEKQLEVIPELEGCWKSLGGVFQLFSDVKITESYVFHEELKYKGVIDCIAEYRGKPMIIDWKKSDKIKSSIDKTYDGPLQIAAYIGAANFDHLYPFKIEEGLLIMSYTDGTKADVFHLNKEACQHYWNQWLQRLQKYRSLVKENDLRIEY